MNNLKKASILFCFHFIFCFQVISQNTLTYSKNDSHLRNGLEYFERNNFAAAKLEFSKYKANVPDSDKNYDYNLITAEYYITICSLYLDAPDAEILASRFVAAHPNHPKSATLYKELGNYYFNAKIFDKSIYYFSKIAQMSMFEAERVEVLFKLGMSYFNVNELKKSKVELNKVKASTITKYAIPASYYCGVIDFKNAEYDSATTYFKRIENSEAYKEEAPFWIANAYYKQEKFDELVAYAEPKLKNPSSTKVASELAILVADIYFQKAVYVKASNYYDQYKKLSKAALLADVRYRVGFSQYKNKRYTEAIENLKQIATRNDEIGQNASYYLGVSYLNSQNLSSALAAFDAARRLNFNKAIKEDAAFNHSKVQVALGNSTQAIKELSEFNRVFPDSNYENEANELLSEAYLSSNNYLGAILYIERLTKRTPKINTIYQKMTYNQGIIDYNAQKYDQAIVNFDKSLSNSVDIELKNSATYFKAESYFLQKKYTAALPIYNSLQGNSTLGLKGKYSIGYIYYSQKDYEKAATYFKDFTTQMRDKTPRPNYDDALVRLADCYFAQKNYVAATQTYDLVALAGDEELDYATFQKGQTLQFQGKEALAKESYARVIREYPNSSYADDAMYKYSEIEMAQGNIAGAVSGFSKLISQKPKSYWIPLSYLKRAIGNTNLKNNEAAINDYRYILANFPNHSTAEEALLGLQEVLNSAGRSDEFNTDLQTYKRKNPTGNSTEALEYETAKNIYFAQQYQKAIVSLQDFIKNYPTSASIIEAKYYLGDAYNRTGDKANALKYFYSVISGNSSSYVSRAAFRAAEIETSQKNYSKAIANYRILSQAGANKKDQLNAWIGLMENYFEVKNYDSTLVFAKEVANGGSAIAGAQNKGLLYTAKVYLAKGETSKAITEFENLAKSAKDEYGAEAKYNLALLTFKAKKYKETVEHCKALSNDFSDFENWRGKAFLLIADCYIAQDDMLNAKAVLNSIIENSPDATSVAEAKAKLSTLK